MRVRKDKSRLGQNIEPDLETLKIVCFKQDLFLQEQKERNIAGTNKKDSIVPNLSNVEFLVIFRKGK